MRTGAGLTRPDSVDGQIYQQATGLPVPVQAITVQIGGQAAVVTASSAVQGEAAGMIRVTTRIAANAAVGPAVPVVLRVGQAPAQTGVTVAVR